MHRRFLIFLVTALLLGACSSNEVLLTRPAAVPSGLNFSGNWVVSADTGSTQPAARELLVHVFLETGKALKVTQTDSGLFFSFDRSVVEEYRFGENREISVGAISAARASGWDGRTYVIETLDEEGAKLIETYRMERGGSILLRTMEIVHRNVKKLSREQVLNRV
jgi:hypothetical protein